MGTLAMVAHKSCLLTAVLLKLLLRYRLNKVLIHRWSAFVGTRFGL
jgi:hypothetical protein